MCVCVCVCLFVFVCLCVCPCGSQYGSQRTQAACRSVTSLQVKVHRDLKPENVLLTNKDGVRVM